MSRRRNIRRLKLRLALLLHKDADMWRRLNALGRLSGPDDDLHIGYADEIEVVSQTLDRLRPKNWARCPYCGKHGNVSFFDGCCFRDHGPPGWMNKEIPF